MIKTLDELLEQANNGNRITVAVAAAEDEAALTAIVEAANYGIAEGILFGDTGSIQSMLASLSAATGDCLRIEEVPEGISAAQMAVKAVRSRKAQILLKGKIKTAELLKAVLDSEAGLRTGRLLSDVFVFEMPGRSGNKLIMITDGGVTLKPDVKQKIEIIQNAVEVAHALGNSNPKVALLSAVETVTSGLSSTCDAAVITKMWQRGQLKGCIVDGPLALDNAVSPNAAAIKGIDSPVAGYAEILVCPDIDSANMLAKSTTYFAGFRLAHVVMGASAPVLIPSRADTADAKLMSIALGKLICQQ
jgi:phosphate butyryltransferase